MKRYLVGGAVRDRLLGLPTKDRDWVVTGSTPEALLQAGYQQVGKDFPVFLHPVTKEEHALARTERKSGKGYAGFVCDFHPGISLEEDLGRRDLTINAIAEDENGQLIDPFGGAKDLEQGILRHVSPAFAEDPLRILRVARFYSRLQPLGFKVAPETLSLLKNMVSQGELKALTAERVWQEIDRSLNEAAPQRFFELLREINALATILPELDALFEVPHSLESNGESTVGLHTLSALHEASKLSTSGEVRFATLCHDFGKADTLNTHTISGQENQTQGLEFIQNLSKRLRIPKKHTELASLTSLWHAHVHQVFKLNALDILNLIEKADALRRPERFNDFLIACEAVARANLKLINNSYRQRRYLNQVLEQLQTLDVRALIQDCENPKEIAATLHQARLNTIKKVSQSFKTS